MNKLRGLKDRHPPIGDVRGIDLKIGVEIVRDPEAPARRIDVAVLLRVLNNPLLSFNFSLKLGHFDPPVHPVSSR